MRASGADDPSQSSASLAGRVACERNRGAIQPMEATMRTKTMLMVIAALALGIVGAVSTAQARGGGGVKPCDLSGVNPVFHKAIFRNAERAAQYGFVKGQDGNWQVDPKLCGR